MKPLNLPHQEPILFAKGVLSLDENVAHVKVSFESIPTLPMLVESAAQSSGAFSNEENKSGFLVSLKNIVLLHKPTSLDYDVKVTFEHQLESLRYFKFEIRGGGEQVFASGVFVIAIIN